MNKPIYTSKKDDFSRVPDELMRSFGTPQMAMLLPLDGRKNWLTPIWKSETGVKRTGLLPATASAV
nr:YcgL domain [Klebsiella pneumoniae]